MYSDSSNHTADMIHMRYTYSEGLVDNSSICGNLWISDNPTSHHHVLFIEIHNLIKKLDKVFFVREAISKIYFVSVSVSSILN